MHSIRFQLELRWEFTAPPDPIAGFKGPTFNGREKGKEGEKRRGNSEMKWGRGEKRRQILPDKTRVSRVSG